MKLLTTFLIIVALAIYGVPDLKAQADMSGFENLFEAANSSVGGGGTGNTDQSQSEDRDGGGSIEMINANWPVTGKMIIRNTNLTWDEGIEPTKITLKQGADLIFTAPVSGNSISVDFTKLNLDSNKNYNLQLTDGEINSKRTAIKFVDPTELENALATLESDLSYKKADGVKKKLMKAFFLEKSGLNYEAYEAYHISTSNPVDMKIILTFFNGFKSRT